ncbi:YdbC family protein [Bacillus songklensis]|uniref:YdbC family protein n=1 Tax=Bacillus songklensis TaxID=1069116 RepID=A0ABV8B4Q5_9BACI
MLAKMMTCHVHDNQKDVFSYKQQHWAALAHVDGFIGQLGGWNVDQPTEAFVLGLWENEEMYQDFMKHTHDSIFYKSGQEATYHHLDVNISKQSQSMGGRYNFFRSSALESRYIMVTTCKLQENQPYVMKEIIQQLTHPAFRCLFHIAAPVNHETITIISLYSAACPPNTIDRLIHPAVSAVKQHFYELEPNWLVLKQPS